MYFAIKFLSMTVKFVHVVARFGCCWRISGGVWGWPTAGHVRSCVAVSWTQRCRAAQLRNTAGWTWKFPSHLNHKSPLKPECIVAGGCRHRRCVCARWSGWWISNKVGWVLQEQHGQHQQEEWEFEGFCATSFLLLHCSNHVKISWLNKISNNERM